MVYEFESEEDTLSAAGLACQEDIQFVTSMGKLCLVPIHSNHFVEGRRFLTIGVLTAQRGPAM